MTAHRPIPHTRWSDAELEILRSMAAQGAPATAIAERIGRSPPAVSKAAWQRGFHVPLPRSGRAEQQPAAAPEPSAQRALEPPSAVIPRRDRVAEVVASMQARGASDQAIASSLRLKSSEAARYGLVVRECLADPYGMDRRGK